MARRLSFSAPSRAIAQCGWGGVSPSRSTSRVARMGTFTAPAGETGIGGNLKVLGGYKARSSRVVTRLDGALDLDCGGRLEEIDVTWEEWGDPTLDASRTVYIIPSFSNSSHAARNIGDPSPGWWDDMIGPNKWIDTNHFRVVCASNLGAPFGTTSPLSIDPSTGKQYRMGFPQITPADQARVHQRLLQHLGFEDSIHSVIGNSMGGMVALQFAALFPDSVNRLGVTACTAQTTPGTVARRRVQRRAIVSDPNFADGNYGIGNDLWPTEGMKVAREIGMICYRSRQEFDQRFQWHASPDDVRNAAADSGLVGGQAVFEVEKYMQYMGRKFAQARYDPCCYLVQSRSMDLMDIGFGFGSFAEGTLRITADRVFACGILQDELIPAHELEQFAKLLKTRKLASGNAGHVQYEPMDSLYGHDAFFKEIGWLGPHLKSLIEDGMEEELRREDEAKPMMAI